MSLILYFSQMGFIHVYLLISGYENWDGKTIFSRAASSSRLSPLFGSPPKPVPRPTAVVRGVRLFCSGTGQHSSSLFETSF